MTDIKLPLEARIARLEANGFQYASAGDVRALVERVRKVEAALADLCDWIEHEVGAELPFDTRRVLEEGNVDD